MLNIKEIHVPEYEKVIEITDDTIDLKAYIALHNCSLGPALGGVRICPFASKQEALTDVLRLAKAMTYKSAFLENGLGGGKSVIIADPKKGHIREKLCAFAKAINQLEGKYIAAEDIGTTVDDMAILKKYTPYVAALPTRTSSGDPSRFTAYGIFRGMQAVAFILWADSSLKGKRIAIQGLGQVGSKLASILFWQEAQLIFADKDLNKARNQAALYGAEVVKAEEIYSIECDIFSPCSIGGILNAKSIAQLNCLAIAGSANNQLLRDRDGTLLWKDNILYAPDYVINSGGIINVAQEFNPAGYDPKISRAEVNKIYDHLIQVFEQAKKEHKPTHLIADQIAEYKLKMGIGRRFLPITFQ